MVKYEYVDSFDVLFKHFQEVLKTDITQIKSYFQFCINELRILGLVHCFADSLSSLTSTNPGAASAWRHLHVAVAALSLSLEMVFET
jgi:hypothetical protein